MDVCTLSISAWITLQGCMALPVCTTEDGKQFCTPGNVTSCPQPEPIYHCTRPDGTKYQMKQDRKTVLE